MGRKAGSAQNQVRQSKQANKSERLRAGRKIKSPNGRQGSGKQSNNQKHHENNKILRKWNKKTIGISMWIPLLTLHYTVHAMYFLANFPNFLRVLLYQFQYRHCVFTRTDYHRILLLFLPFTVNVNHFSVNT